MKSFHEVAGNVLYNLKREMMSTPTEVAKKFKLSRSFIHWLLQNDRIEGAYKASERTWLIPSKWKYKKKRKGEKHGPKPIDYGGLQDPSQTD